MHTHTLTHTQTLGGACHGQSVWSHSSPVKRLVLFVADGFRADTVFSLNEDKTTPAPIIGRINEL